MGARAASTSAQWPGVLTGTAVDALNGEPIAGAWISVEGAQQALTSDGLGVFTARALEPGLRTVRYRAFGYLEGQVSVEVLNGRVTRVTLRLTPSPLQLGGIDASASERIPGFQPDGGWIFSRERIEGSAARTVGELLRVVPGLVVREDVTGGAQHASIRGSAPDAVLVLLDGAPLNDPVTGTADLSQIGLGSVESVAVRPGAQSARFGRRAAAGVIEVRSRTAVRSLGLRSSVGSLGARGLALEGGGNLGSVRIGAGGEWRSSEGAFSFDLPPEVGGGSGQRVNSDSDQRWAWASGRGTMVSGELAVRFRMGRTERGLPGKAFQPSASARQRTRHTATSVTWTGAAGSHGLRISTAGGWRTTRFHDSAPPFGIPFDERTRLFQASVRMDYQRVSQRPWSVGGGMAFDHLRVRSDGLSSDLPTSRSDAGLYLRTARTIGSSGSVSATARMDRSAEGAWQPSHELAAAARVGRLHLRLAHRSSFSPPTLGDQYFREGVGVRPNPDLAPERIESELEVGARASFAGVRVGATAYVGDVQDMIVWQPDFRFVWSPANTDVRRRGFDAWTEIAAPMRDLSLSLGFGHARFTYDRPGPDTVQVAYRPRHTATVKTTWSPPGWSLAVGGYLTGVRNPTPSAANRLPAFWAWDLVATRRWSVGPWHGDVLLGVDRLLDRRDTLIFAYPSPGRTLRFELRLGRGDAHANQEPLAR